MLKTDQFNVLLIDKMTVYIPKKYALQFYNNGHKRVKVKASSNTATIEFHAALIREKSGQFKIYFSKAKQNELDVSFNDYFKIQLFEDTSKYGVELSEEFEAVLLSDYDAYTIFEALTAGKQRSIIYAIARYKSSQTRIDKALLLTKNLKRGITDPKLWLKN